MLPSNKSDFQFSLRTFIRVYVLQFSLYKQMSPSYLHHSVTERRRSSGVRKFPAPGNRSKELGAGGYTGKYALKMSLKNVNIIIEINLYYFCCTFHNLQWKVHRTCCNFTHLCFCPPLKKKLLVRCNRKFLILYIAHDNLLQNQSGVVASARNCSTAMDFLQSNVSMCELGIYAITTFNHFNLFQVKQLLNLHVKLLL